MKCYKENIIYFQQINFERYKIKDALSTRVVLSETDMLEHLGKTGDAVLNAGNRLGRRLPVAGGIVAELFAVDASDSLQACEGQNVTVILEETLGVELPYKFVFAS